MYSWHTAIVRNIIPVCKCPKFEEYWYLKREILYEYLDLWAQVKDSFKHGPLFFTMNSDLFRLSGGRLLLSTVHLRMCAFLHILLSGPEKKNLCYIFLERLRYKLQNNISLNRNTSKTKGKIQRIIWFSSLMRERLDSKAKCHLN